MKAIYDLAFYRCHQFPHHSLFWQGFQFPVCARDTGISIGFLLGILALYLARNYRSRNIDPRFLLLFAPMAVDGVFQFAGIWASTFLSRFITGMLSGLGIGIVFVSLFQKEKKERVPSFRSLLYFSLIAIPFFGGYWMIELGYGIGFVGDLLFWIVVWSVPFIYFLIGVVATVIAWRFFKKVTDEMESLLNSN